MNAILTCLKSSHDPALLALAALVCAVGVYGSSAVARHAGRVDGSARARWAAVGITAAGCTAWATHMVALLAFRPGMRSGFDPWMTALSLLLAVAGIGAGLLVVVGRRDAWRRFAGGVILGIGVALLHYVGQVAYVVRGVEHWDHGLVAVSLLVALPLFGLSLVVSGGRNRSLRTGGAPLLLVSIAVLHLSGMAALQLEFDPRIELPSSAVSPEVLAPAVAIICFGLLCVAIMGLRLTLHAKAVLRRERLRLGELANLALEGLAICDGDRILTVNDSLATLCGMAPGELVGRSLRSLVPGRDLLALPEREEADADVVTSAGKLLPVRVLRSEVRLGGRPQTIIAFRDQRERLRSEERIRTLAYTDGLTGLANRTHFHAMLDDQVAVNQDGARPFSLLTFDLDGFKSVNDAFGHGGGDEVLQIVARRVRASLDERHLLARLGGDEFAVLLDGSADPLVGAGLGQRIIAAIEEPIRVHQQVVHLSASVGLMPSPPEAVEADDLLMSADLALYEAKANGRGHVRLFTPELRQASVQRSSMAQELGDAWEERSFELYYQPQVALASGDITGAEALLRWNYPYCGVLAPAAFLSVLEVGHLAVPVGDWILQSACRQAAAWRAAGLEDFRIGVNLFPAQLRMGDFVERVEEALIRSGLPAHALELEVTENVVLQSERTTASHLKRLRAMGVGIAFDDFGTGYASLTMLKQLDITRLKIDRSFVREIETNRKDQAIVDAVIRMAEGCDLAVIAEGIETKAQADYLRGRLPEGQGYLFGKPMTGGSFSLSFVEPAEPIRRTG
jgi:diguanylate cyclase (GGDEF)-like protein/PAS domain S-box-containing protein